MVANTIPCVFILLLLMCLVVAVRFEEEKTPSPAVVEVVRTMQETMTPEERKDPVIIAESNVHFHRMTRWWIDGMKKLDKPIDKFVIVALDPVEYHWLKKMGQTVAWSHGMNMNYTATAFRSDQYNQIVNYKWQIIVDLLKFGHDLLLTDVDIYWRKNPMAYLRSLPYCHMYVSVDTPALPRDKSSPLRTKPPRLYPPFGFREFKNFANTGFCYLRSTPQVISLAETVLKRPLPGMDDQHTFNIYFNELWLAHKATSNATHGPNTCANYGDLTFHMLRPDMFQNYAIHVRNPQFDDIYYTLHFNWVGNYTAKINAMITGGFMNGSH